MVQVFYLALLSGFAAAADPAGGGDPLVICIASDCLRGYGVADAELKNVAQPALGFETAWLDMGDYPAAALRAGEQGAVTAMWSIGADGRVGDCRIVRSSGSALLDAETCRRITRRARYRPALDATGSPVASHRAATVTWSFHQ